MIHHLQYTSMKNEGFITGIWVLDKGDNKYKEVVSFDILNEYPTHTEVLITCKEVEMKAIEIQAKQAIHQKAFDVLSCIALAKQKIDHENDCIRLWNQFYYYTKESCLKNIETHKAAIVRLEAYYHKIVSQL